MSETQSEEEKAVNLYDGETMLGEKTPVPIGYLLPNQPYIKEYTLRNNSRFRVFINDGELGFNIKLESVEDNVKLVNILPRELAPQQSCPFIVQWTVKKTPKIYGDEGLGRAVLVADYGILIEGK